MAELSNEDLYEAVKTSNIDECIDLIKKYHETPDRYSFLNMDIALIVSIPTLNVNVISLLLNNQASVKYTDKFGRRAIHVAAATGNQDVLKLILKAGSPVNVADAEGKTPLHLACETGCDEMVELLLSAGANINRSQTYRMKEYPVHIAAKKGYTKILETLRLHGANFEAQATLQRTPLHYAILHKQYTTVNYLCSVGVNMNAADEHGETALFLALSNGLMQMTRHLLQLGVCGSVLTSTGRSVLHYVPSLMTKSLDDHSHDDTYEALVKSGVACINSVSDNGAPLHTAVNAR